ncbi:MAG: 50S ribosomal protein L29 [Deltaproteobacteria bacterium]|nr:50S ribosomal protein L29 [Deltaproteobacteria bacterium]
MKRKEFLNEVKGLSTEDLTARARTMSEELLKLRFRNASGQLTQGHRIGELKRNIARINTMMASKKAEASAK